MSSARTDLYDIETLMAGARRLEADGASTEDLLAYLRESGASPIASMAVLHQMTGITVSEAKGIVWASQTWADKRADQDSFIADAEKVVNDAGRRSDDE